MRVQRAIPYRGEAMQATDPEVFQHASSEATPGEHHPSFAALSIATPEETSEMGPFRTP